MGKGKKKFIEKKHATTFKVLHRSQRDPLIADNDVGDRVLHPVPSSTTASEEVLDERNKYGIYYRDNYDYLKHLKQVGEVVELDGVEIEREVIRAPTSALTNLPSILFETKGVELKVGMLNKNAPNNELLPDIDPDIVAALEGDDCDGGALMEGDEDDELEDNFIQLANPDGDEELLAPPKKRVTDAADPQEVMRRFGLVRERGKGEELFSSGDEEEEESDDDDEMREDGEEETDDDEEEEQGKGDALQKFQKSIPFDDKRSHFTNYSMSSAVVKREDGLRVVDDHFEQLFEQYADDEIGEGGEEELPLTEPDSDRLQPFVEAQFEDRKRFPYIEKPSDDLKQKTLAREQLAEERGEQTEKIVITDAKRRSEWDCESILSTYSNIYNHPTLICPPPSAGGQRKRRRQNTDQESTAMETESVVSSVRSTASTFRPRDETTDERRARKQLVKEERRERRQEKKALKTAFKNARVELCSNQKVGGPQNIRPIK